MRGIMAKPDGGQVEIPILASFREGLDVQEFFLSSHGSRKGTADTALKTADAGYLTRRLVDVVQDLIIKEEDCGTIQGLEVSAFVDDKSGSVLESFEERILGRFTNQKVINPETYVEIEQDGYLEMDTVQIGGVDSTKRNCEAILKEGAKIVVKEKIMTDGEQFAETKFKVELNGEDSAANLISRSVAKGNSHQRFISKIDGNTKCTGHSECDAIVMDNAIVSALPEVTANSVDASLIHEAAIGKIAGEQIIKLMTLGLTEEEAEARIIEGFME